MPDLTANGVRLSYKVQGEGDPVVLVCGTGQPALTWDFGVAGRLRSAGYQVVTFDNRGVAPSEMPPPPYSVGAMAADAAGLIEDLGLGPCRVAGLSLGAFITQELALARPDLVRGAAMMGTFARKRAINVAWEEAKLAIGRSGVALPPHYEATMLAFQVVGRRNLLDDGFVSDFLALSAAAPSWEGPGIEGQLAADLAYDNRLGALGGVTVPCLVVGFADDLLTSPVQCREVADAIPGARYVEIPDLGHLGPIEDPDAVVPALLEFFATL